MTKYIRTRLALAVPTILLTSLVVFLMLLLIPGDPASIYVGEQPATPERLAEIRRVMGLDRPLHVQYADFLWRPPRRSGAVPPDQPAGDSRRS